MKLKTLKQVKDPYQLKEWIVANKFGVHSKYKGNSLLHLAVYTKELKVVQVVTQAFHIHNFSLKLKNNLGETPKDLADKLNLVDICYWFENPDISLYQRRDPFAEFYKILEKNQNSSVIRFDYTDLKGAPIKKHKINHYRGSGRSVYNYYTRKYNVNHKIKHFNFKPLWFTPLLKIMNFLAVFVTRGPKAYPWKNFKFKVHNNLKLNYYPISLEESAKILNYLKRHNLHILHFGLTCANKVLKERLLKKDVETEWVVANSYSLIKKPYAEGYNDMSMIPVTIKKDSDLTNQTKKVQKDLKQSFILGKFYRLNYEVIIMNFLYNLWPFLIKSLFTKNKSRFGSLSYFDKGEVDMPMVAGKVTPTNFCNISYFIGVPRGQIVLTMDIHESIRNNENIEEILKLISEEMIKEALRETI